MPVTDHPSPPPLPWLLAYRVLGLRLPDEYHEWVVRDTKSRSFLTWRGGRTLLWLLVLGALLAVGVRVGLGTWPHWKRGAQFLLLALAIALFSSRDQLVRRTLRWHRIDRKGRPVATPKRLARLDNREAFLLGLVALVAWTGGATAFGHALRPTGIAAAPCHDASREVLDVITSKRRDDRQYTHTSMVRFEGGTIVLALVEPPKPGEKGSLEAWLLGPDGVFRLIGPDQEKTTTTTHPRLDRKPDRVVSFATQRAAECLVRKADPREK